jgi:glycosyltransferase involved in cell wall biosynthesis
VTNNNPCISVIIPVLNSAKTIEKALLSVLFQDYEPIQLIVLDAGSTDGTVDIIKRYQDKIAYWHSKRDGSPGLAINMGFKQATGDLVAQLMADDWFEPGTFKLVAEAYRVSPEVDMVSCGGRFVYFDEKKQAEVTKRIYIKPSELEINLKNACYGMPALSSRFIAKRYIDRIGDFDTLDEQGKHNFSVDREYVIRAAVLGCENKIIPHLGHTYFMHEGSATFGSNRANQLKILKEHLVIVKKYLNQYPEALKHRSFFKQWYAHQSVRLFAFQLMQADFRLAVATLKDGMAVSAWRWVYCLIELPVQWIWKKLWFTLKKKNSMEEA